jgi:membrane carboxypeptidase/penicillin-binding protein PbpC
MYLSTRAAAIAATLTLLLSGCGSSSSDPASGPAIVTQPASATIIAGSNSVLSVIASGSGLTYQWYQDGIPIAKATSAIHTATAAGTYYVVVTADDGSVTSANAVSRRRTPR